MFKRVVAVLAAALLLATLIQFPNNVEAASASEVKQWKQSLQSSISKKNWTNAAIFSKRLAVHYDEAKKYDEAVKYYEDSADYWTKAGHPSWGIANIIRAEQISTELELYVERPLPLNQKLEKFEPAGGTYLGMYVAGKREKTDPAKVKEIYGKNHAMYLTYSHWRKKYPDTNSYFPLSFAKKAKELGSGIQVAWEPSFGLDDVKDDEYVRQFAREAKQSGVPVFLRFAGEMNGEWVPWHDDPKKYREKFKLIHDIMKEEAPNVAMVWSPNFLPRHNIKPFYPGDKYVDWVGFSLYTIPFSHGEEVPGGNPIDYLKPLYEEYGHKPIMISEGAVSHVSYEQKKDYSKWAVGQIGNMYGFMPKMYPKLKAITYFNLDKMTTNYDNQNNNYDLGDSKIVDQAYQRMIKHPYFIDHIKLNGTGNQVRTEFVPVGKIKEVEGQHNAFVYVKLPLGNQPYYVAAYQGKTKLGESYAQPWEMKIDFKKVNTKDPITLIAFDKNFKRLATKNVKASFKKVKKIGKFTDVKATHWAFSAIEEAETKGIVTGYPGGSFRPNQKVKVAEFATIMGRTYDKKAELDKSPYPKGTIDFMKAMNYPYGEKSTADITRLEAAEIVAGTQGVNLSGDDAIKYLLVNGLSNGKNPDRISVKDYAGSDTLTRAEAVMFAEHAKRAGLKQIEKRPVEPTDPAEIRQQYKEKFE